MESKDLTRSQLAAVLRQVERQRDYYHRLWQRVEANGFPVTDPLVVGLCEAWEALGRMEKLVAGMVGKAREPNGRPAAHPLRNTTR